MPPMGFELAIPANERPQTAQLLASLYTTARIKREETFPTGKLQGI